MAGILECQATATLRYEVMDTDLKLFCVTERYLMA